jgi:NAD(P)-dependent dehydrogenase (short-subunit alcohol dehydrogenase family)
MLEHRWGRIVNVSTGVVDRPEFMVGGNTYVETKSALEAHTKSLAAEPPTPASP